MTTGTEKPPKGKEAEEWRPVVGYEGHYAVSDHGRVMRTVGGQGARAGKIKRLHPNRFGYLSVILHKNGERKTCRVHVLVAEAFLGPRPDGYDTNHIDGVKANCVPSNLEYVTRSQNIAHAWKIGLMTPPVGMKKGCSKLTDNMVRDIRKLQGVLSHSALGRFYGVARQTITKAIDRRTWAHIK